MSPIRTFSLRPVRSAFVWSLILTLDLACSSVGAVDWEVQRAVIQYASGEPLSLALPGTVSAGAPTTITLRTQGTRYCTRPGRTDLSAAGMVVTLEPYDSVYVGDFADCPTVPCDCAHTVNITFPSAGAATLRVIGRRGISPGVVTVDTVLNVQ